MSGQRRLIIADDEEVEPGESNPFSFREFLRSKNHDQDLDLKQETRHIRDEDWGRSFYSTTSLCTEKEEEEEEDEEKKEMRFLSTPDVKHNQHGAEYHERDKETSTAEQLKEENTSLRSTIRVLQRTSYVNEQRVLELSAELLQRRHQEEKEARDLESMVHSVEQNLHLMTKRAVKAENSVSKLKAELQQLQVEVESLRLENCRLKATESQVVMTMRQNAHVAAEHLKKTTSHAHASIRGLLEEATTLHLVSDLLQSIDRISNLDTES